MSVRSPTASPTTWCSISPAVVAGEDDVLANDRHVLVLSDRRARQGSREVEMRAASIYHVRDEKIAEAWLMEWDPYAIDGFLTD